MGTRNLTRVIRAGEVKVAQYGQWDGYPEGQGITALTFLRNHENVMKLVHNLDACRFATSDELEAVYASYGSENGFMSFEDGQRLTVERPELSRDTCAGILEVVATRPAGEEILLADESEFINDHLFCEWAYTVNYDTRTFDVWTDGHDLVSFNLYNLPSDEQFLNAIRVALKVREDVQAHA